MGTTAATAAARSDAIRGQVASAEVRKRARVDAGRRERTRRRASRVRRTRRVRILVETIRQVQRVEPKAGRATGRRHCRALSVSDKQSR